MATAKNTNEKAIRKVLNAWKDLILVKNNGTIKTPDQKAKISASIDALKAEFLRLKGVSPDGTYADAAKLLTDAKSDLDDIVEDRKRLADNLISAGKILGSIRSVLGLIA